MNQISIIILNYNTTEFTKKCLKSILAFKDDSVKEIIVIDNSSSDRSIENLKNGFPNVKYFFRNLNDGFAGGCNFGVSKSSGDFILFLNPDVLIKENIFLKLADFLNKNVNAGILSGVMKDENGNVEYFYNDFPDIGWEAGVLYPPILRNKIEKLNSKSELFKKNDFSADWFHGSFMFMRKSDFINAGCFNENYFMYYEDVELSYKFKKKLGKENICIPEISYYHSKKSSLANELNDDLYTFHINRSKLIFIRNYGFFQRTGIYLTGLLNIFSRILILPFWSKYADRKLQKFKQLLKILKLYFSNSYLLSSKFEYIRN